MVLSDRLREAMTDSGLNQRELARLCGVSAPRTKPKMAIVGKSVPVEALTPEIQEIRRKQREMRALVARAYGSR